MTKSDQIKNNVATRYNQIKNAPAHRNLAEAITSALIIIACLAYFAIKVIKFTLQVIGYWFKAMIAVFAVVVWLADKLAPINK